jgi:hypothetical protein
MNMDISIKEERSKPDLEIHLIKEIFQKSFHSLDKTHITAIY